MKVITSVAAVVLMASGIGRSEEVGVLVEHFELGKGEATRLLLEDEDPVALRAAMDRSGAKLRDLAYLLAVDGRKSNAQSIVEYLYPTEWDPAQVFWEIAADVEPGMDLKVPAHPVSYEAKNLGNTLTVSGIDKKSDPSAASLSSELSRLLVERRFGKEELGIVQPEFEVAKIDSDPGFDHGQPILLGVSSPREIGRQDQRVFAFATPFVRHHAEENSTARETRADVEPFAHPEPGAQADVLGVSIGVELIEVAQSQVAGLLAGVPHRLGENSQVREKAEKLIAAGQASVFASGTLKSTIGQRARIEPVHEFIYPMEYNPPVLVPKLTAELIASGAPLKTPAVPNAFDVRNLGMTIEAEPTLVEVDGVEMIELTIAPEFVDLARQIHWGKDEAVSKLPVFRTLRCNTKFRVMPGDEALVAIFTPRKKADGAPDGDRRILLTVWVELARVDQP
ncbi:MAG: hypothetical protein ACR2RV_22295 [Verrucomicrobiales bacterium]